MKRTPKTCVNCRRLLTECNRAPCPEKLEKAKAKSFAKAAGAQKSSSSSSPQSSPPSPSKSLSGSHLIGDDSGQHATASGQTTGKKRKKRSSYGPSNPYHYREKGNNHHMGGSSNSSAAGGAGPMGIGNYPNYYPDPSFPWGHGPSGSPDFYPPPPPQYPLFQPPFPNLGPFSALPPKAQPTSSPISIRSVDGKEYNTGNLVAGSNDVGDQDILNLTKKLASSSVSGGASESGGLDLSLFAGSQSILELEGMEKHFHDPNALHNFQVVQLLNNRSQLIGKVHQAVVKNHSEQGIVVDLVVYDNSALGARDPNRTPLLSHEKAKPGPFSLAKFNPNVVDELLEPFLQDYDLYHDLLEPKMSGRKPSIENTHGSRYVIFDVTLFWSHLSTHLKSLSEDLLIDLSSSHIPRLSTFHVYCFGLYSPAMPLIKMATRPNPILSLGPNIKKYFEDFDPTCPVSTTQPTQPSTPTVTISSVTISAPVSVSVSSVSSSPPAAAATGSSPSTSSSPNSDTLLDLSQAIKRKSGIEISVSTEQGLQPKILSVPATNLTHQVAKLVADKRPSNSPRYLIIVDFEATCDFAPRPVVTNQTSEIIEFPWVVLDTKTLEIVHQTRFYIRPDNLDGVTRYCKALTGISRQDCESGIPLREAISIFDEYVKTHMLPNGPNSFRIVTDGVWDLQVQLLQEAARKDIPLEWWYREYFDLKAEYRKTYSWFAFTIQGPPLFVMLQSFGLDFVGRHHSGLDDCKTICQVVRVLLQISPHSFTHAQSIPIDYDPYQDDSWYQFMNHCPVESWQCSDQECLVWNNPRYQACNFCHTPRKKDQ